jgi:hypothetical protein
VILAHAITRDSYGMSHHSVETVPRETLAQLEQLDTCTVSNAIEQFQVRTAPDFSFQKLSEKIQGVSNKLGTREKDPK